MVTNSRFASATADNEHEREVRDRERLDRFGKPSDDHRGEGEERVGLGNGSPPMQNDRFVAALQDDVDYVPSEVGNQRRMEREKIKVHLVAVGRAPILKKSKFLMNADDRFAVAIAFLRKVLKLSSSSATTSNNTTGIKASSLFLYVNAAFVPSPDERIGDLFDCFGSRGELVIHYSLQEAWG